MLSMVDQDYLSEFYAMLERAPRLDVRLLGKFEHVHIKVHDYERDRFPLGRLTNFLLLPSLRNISGLRPHQADWTIELLEPSRMPNVTDLELHQSFIGSDFLDQFLRHFPPLQSFIYASSHYSNPDGDILDPFIIGAVLHARVPTTLRRLTILVHRRKDKEMVHGSAL